MVITGIAGAEWGIRGYAGKTVAVESGGTYSVLATLGESRDRGAEFEITLLLVSGAVNQQLEAWVKNADASGKYTGIPLPSVAAECRVPPKVVVVKTE